MNDEKTIIAPRSDQAPKLFILCGEDVAEHRLSGRQSFGRPSRKNVPDLSADSKVVSRAHGLFESSGPHCCYTDLDSTNGTSLNGRMLDPNAPQLLYDGDVLRVHSQEDEDCTLDTLMVFSVSYHEGAVWRRLPLSAEIASVDVGRAEGLVLSDQSVSRRHASFFSASGGWAIIDHGSLNGVRLNGRAIDRPAYLKPMDVVDIAGYLFIFLGSELIYQADAAAPTLPEAVPAAQPEPVSAAQHEAVSPAHPEDSTPSRSPEKPAGKDMLCVWIEERNVWARMKKKTLLRDVRLEIESGSMVLVLGGSGAGKTTFLNAVMGFERASGRITYNQTDIYAEYEKMKYEIGYVPQKDLLRLNDTVLATLQNAARMRLPADLTDAQYDEAVERTIAALGLDRVRHSLAGKLSGGQLKRLSIAVEYIGDPSLFFLDEPDSGLDGTMARSLMENLRAIADDGRIVIVISHSPDRAFDLWDKVIVLAKDSREDCGRLAYYGAPRDACAFFGVDTLERIVKRINRPDEGGDGMADYYIEEFEKRGART